MSHGHDKGYNGGFALLVVLFILLIIIGSAWF
ncbi:MULTISPECIES: YjcZ family sporulation protein [Jeotgalibacillus]|uniref:YjcZ family sporulation protein n=1 Tax=Jeotgalibacillus salarius TaxID=546023 RepID=A0A4Y8LAP0_9BACL|nr:YjcZ family sporulation protein [Jeotgalibacillus salarius]TFD99224.1 YjcZ family sporulation protein [Jeotgalibacillus salarius]